MNTFHGLFHFIIFSGSISTADGSALVKLGNTTVICGIKAVGLICLTGI